jgi:hypothetical protein
LKADARAPEAGEVEDEMSTTEDELEGDGPDDIEDIDDLEDLEDGDLDDEVVLDDDSDGDDDSDVALDDEVAAVLVVAAPPAKAKAAEPAEAAADTEVDEDELQADEVEASLDVILADRLRGDISEIDEPNEDDEDEEDDAPNQLATVIPVRRPDEFLCQSCFLLKPPAQLADADHQLCRDCA